TMDSYRASNLRQSSDLRKALRDCMRDTTALLGVGIGVPSIASTKVVAVTAADWAWIDTEHTPLSPTLMADIVQTVNYHSEGRMLPIVRVPSHGHEWIAWALDAGAAGVIIPHTETVEQARAAVRAARFGPLGDRSFPPFVMLSGITDSAPEGQTWVDVANDHIAVIPQIESALGLENLEDIMQVPGVDAIMIGKGDLRLSMGLPL
ncbi:Phosphoenolpyruvate/pyruvate domain-containing protein, partial [Athelia psychrophila]